MAKYNVFVSVFNVLYLVTRAQRVGFFLQYLDGSGRVAGGLGSGGSVLFYILYWVPYLLSGNSGYVRYLG